MDNNNINKNNLAQEEESIDLRKSINYFMGNLHWFLLSAGTALIIAFLINRYTVPIYSISTTVLIEDDNKDSPWNKLNGAGMDLTQGFGLFPSLQNFENQTIILKSYSQVQRTIEQLDFEVSYFGKGRVAEREIYNDAPFEVIYSKLHAQPLGIQFEITISPEGKIKIETEGDEATLYDYTIKESTRRVKVQKIKRELKPGERFLTDYCDFQIKVKENFNPKAENHYFFFFSSLHSLTQIYQAKMSIEPISKGSSMVKISMLEAHPQKAIAFLNQLTNEYLLRNLEKKNEFAARTIEFIDNQLDTISRSLILVEKDLENFRSENKVMDLSYQSKIIFDQVQNLENQKMQLEMQLDYYTYLKNYIEDNQNIESILAPSAMGVQDPLLNNLILEINQLSVEKSSMINIKKNTDLFIVQQLDAQIINAKKNIYENASNLVNSTQLSLNDINRRLNKLLQQVNELPETERQLFGIERKFKLNDNLYTYLLERRAEAQIARASNTADNEVIDKAMPDNNGAPIKPKRMINYLIAFVIGLGLPAIIIALREFFNIHIDSPDMVKKITSRPIIGQIPNTGEGNEMKIFNDLDSPWAESFRIVRSKLQFITKDISNPIILVTSSVPGEGKSFIAINLASAYALTGKKTVLIGADLRRPQIAQRFQLDKNLGITNLLIGQANLDEIIQKTASNNLDIIASGIIPPNPAELLADAKMQALMTELKKRYDYIIIDSAPMSPVSDSHALCRIVDASVYVVRDRFTNKHIFENGIDEAENNHTNNLCILMNDIQLKKRSYGYRYGYSYGYRYGYKYGYGYGYGYYQEKSKTQKKKSKKKA